METASAQNKIMVHYRRIETIELCGRQRAVEVIGGYHFTGTLEQSIAELDRYRNAHSDALSVEVWTTWS